MQPIATEPNRGNTRNPQPLDALQLDVALVRLQTVCGATGLSPSTTYRLLAAGKFPEPVRLGKRCTRWKAADVRAWIQAQGSAV